MMMYNQNMLSAFNNNNKNVLIPMILPMGCCNFHYVPPFDDAYHAAKLKNFISREEFTDSINNINEYIKTTTNTIRIASSLVWFLPLIGFIVFITGIVAIAGSTSNEGPNFGEVFGKMFGGMFGGMISLFIALCVSRAVPARMMDAARAAVRTVNNRFSDRNMVWTFQAPLGNLRMVGGASSLGAKIVIELVDEDNNNGNSNNNFAGIVVGDGGIPASAQQQPPAPIQYPNAPPQNYQNEGNTTTNTTNNTATTNIAAQDLVFCPKCGCKHESSDSFCPKCGTKTVIPQ